LGYEAASQMKEAGIGVSTSIGIGGDPINGSSFKDHLEIFEQDDETKAVVIIGEIGGPQEVEAAMWAKENMTKPVIGYIAGLTAPKGRRMGHAGAIISAVGESFVFEGITTNPFSPIPSNNSLSLSKSNITVDSSLKTDN
jgi:malate-CoA ligase subunit alpha